MYKFCTAFSCAQNARIRISNDSWIDFHVIFWLGFHFLIIQERWKCFTIEFSLLIIFLIPFKFFRLFLGQYSSCYGWGWCFFSISRFRCSRYRFSLVLNMFFPFIDILLTCHIRCRGEGCLTIQGPLPPLGTRMKILLTGTTNFTLNSIFLCLIVLIDIMDNY